jgi:riboflavin synthase
MFTGLVKEVGSVESYENGRLVVRCSTRAALGDSVSISGVCLTVVDGDAGTLAFDVVEETRARAKPFRERVNVEPALRAGEPLGGHYVQGHVDGVGTVVAVTPEGDGARLAIEAPPDLRRYLVEKGSIAVDGVSLTIAGLTETGLEVALVPHTLAKTTLSELASGDSVNLEADVLAKYVERLLADTMPR